MRREEGKEEWGKGKRSGVRREEGKEGWGEERGRERGVG